MRRKDREMPESFAQYVADKCEWAVLALVDLEGNPYCVPISIVREEHCLYFHCAYDGYKTQCLQKNPQVCLSCVGDTHRTPDKFTTEYESAIVRGIASQVLADQEKIHALRLICQRHTPTNMTEFDRAIGKSLHRTAVWKISVSEMTGKRKKYDNNGEELKFGRNQE